MNKTHIMAYVDKRQNEMVFWCGVKTGIGGDGFSYVEHGDFVKMMSMLPKNNFCEKCLKEYNGS